MEQRIYRGSASPEALADHLVQQFDPRDNIQAQKVGQGDSLLVQIGRGDVPSELRHAISVSITRATGDEPGVAVTLGQQQWLDPKMATYAAAMGLVSLLITPWALFALLWPISDIAGSATLSSDIWNTVESYMVSQGARFGGAETLRHPHAPTDY